MIIRNSEDLKYYPLNYGDKVILDGIIYTVDHKNLSNTDFYAKYNNDDEIFYRLGVYPKTFCNTHYGYESRGGIRPNYSYDDYEAATRAVRELYKIIESGKGMKSSEQTESNNETTKYYTYLEKDNLLKEIPKEEYKEGIDITGIDGVDLDAIPYPYKSLYEYDKITASLEKEKENNNDFTYVI